MNRWNSENGRVVTQEDKVNNDYDDIINLPHYEPKHSPRMSMWNRAAQFAPFAALTGYEAAIKDTAQENADSYEAKNSDEAEDYDSTY
ncbi:MAG: hypothetical protein J6T44_10310 [Prevotella sp.]|nr:hypothetical protein [Prevotella sp.]